MAEFVYTGIKAKDSNDAVDVDVHEKHGPQLKRGQELDTNGQDTSANSNKWRKIAIAVFVFGVMAVAVMNHLSSSLSNSDEDNDNDNLDSGEMIVSRELVVNTTDNALSFHDALPRNTPESQGVSSKQIKAFLDEVEFADIELHHFMLARHGSVIAEGSWWPLNASTPHMCHSLTKSVTGTGVGIAIGEKYFELDTKVVDIFPTHNCVELQENAVGGNVMNLMKMTVKNLLTMQCGHEFETSGKVWRSIKTSWIDEFCKIPVKFVPGTKTVYTSAASYMLSAIVTETTGLTMQDYLTPRLFEPMNMIPSKWDVHPADNVTAGGNGLTWKVSDSLKLSMIYTQKGKWNGDQLVPEEWIKNAISKQTYFPTYNYDNQHCTSKTVDGTAAPTCGVDYGFQWWVVDSPPAHNAFFGIGVFSQITVGFPDHDASLAIFSNIRDTARYSGEQIWPYLWKHFPAAFSDDTTPDPINAKLLKDRTSIDSLRLLKDLKPTSSKFASQISQRVFNVNHTDKYQNVTSVMFDFDNKTGAVRYQQVDFRGTHHITAGTKEWIQSSTNMSGAPLHYYYETDYGEPISSVVAGAEWKDDYTLEMTWEYPQTAWRDIVTCRFEPLTPLRGVHGAGGDMTVQIYRKLDRQGENKILGLEILKGTTEKKDTSQYTGYYR